MTGFPILSAITFLPLAGGGLVLLAGGGRRARWIALAVMLATLALAGALWISFDRGSGALQFVEERAWIPVWNIAYGMGVDGISVPFLLLTSILGVLCVGVSWKAIGERAREFYALLLVAQTAMLGFFSAANLFLFFLFWELSLVPLFLLIGVWGGADRVHAAVKFLLFTLAGSVLMFVGMIWLHRACGTLDFRGLALARGALPPAHQVWLFAAFLAAFAVKVPMFPVHTWLPDAHTEAPTAG
ncbi:MAG: NADH-quinone oxidoreductase subunit M, partial [Planctomycetes bacterium]|nr:NADH-quinone oxidoreductase subunit M [Planctomycetota bacterium]